MTSNNDVQGRVEDVFVVYRPRAGGSEVTGVYATVEGVHEAIDECPESWFESFELQGCHSEGDT
ncbi:MAG TPA: hypothetical protein VMZ33_06945 [Candidatus Limnocylindrales bacterium]|nr:hypothetical protein [Candidatus Limnocylindrales bacterium]